MLRATDSANKGGGVRVIDAPDDAMRADGRGPNKGDVCRFRRRVFLQGQPHVCVTLSRPRRVRIGYCRRDEEGGHHLHFPNPAYKPEYYPPDSLIVCGLLEDYCGAWSAADGGVTSVAPRRPERSPVFSDGTIVMWGTNALGTDGWLSPEWYQLAGGTEDDWRRGRWVERLHPDDKRRVLAAWVEAICTCGPYAVSARFLAHDTYRWTSIVGRPELDRGVPSAWRGVMQLRERDESAARVREEVEEQKTA
jgi:hypothetical protein